MKWMIDSDDDDYVCDAHGDQVIVASVVDCGSSEDRRRHAHLIAAAPEMLEALEAISPMLPRSLTTTTYGDPVWTEAIRKVEAAIKKARGEK